MECDLKTFYSSSSPSMLLYVILLFLCISLSPSCLLSSSHHLAVAGGGTLHALIGFIGSSSVVEDADMALDVVLDKDGSAHNIRQSSSLFHLIKKTTLDKNRNMLQCQ